MRVISRKRLREFWDRHGDAEDPLKTWYVTARQACWSNLLDVQRIYARAEAVGDYTVFNIKGNTYRLIARIEYGLQIIFVKDVLTHAEYDKGKRK